MDSIINVSAIQNIVYIGSSILFIFGIKMLGKEATAVRGNYLSAIAMFLAVGITCLNLGIDIKIIISGILILVGGIAMIATPAPEGVERSPLMLFAPAIIQLALGGIKIAKS